MKDPYDCGDSDEDQPADLSEALARTEQQLKRLRPCQPQIDLAEVQRCTRAGVNQTAAIGFSKAHLLYAVAASWLCGIAVGASALHFAGAHMMAAEASGLEIDPHVAAADPLIAGTTSDAHGGHAGNNHSATDAQESPAENALDTRPGHRRQPQHELAAERAEQHHSWVALILDERYRRVSLGHLGGAEPLSATSWRQWGHALPLTLSAGLPLPPRGEHQAPDHRAADPPPDVKISPEGVKSTAPDLLAPSGPIPHRQWLDQLIGHPAELI